MPILSSQNDTWKKNHFILPVQGMLSVSFQNANSFHPQPLHFCLTMAMCMVAHISNPSTVTGRLGLQRKIFQKHKVKNIPGNVYATKG